MLQPSKLFDPGLRQNFEYYVLIEIWPYLFLRMGECHRLLMSWTNSSKFKKNFLLTGASPLVSSQSPMGNGYMKLAQHFRFALNEIFVQKGFARVIIWKMI